MATVLEPGAPILIAAGEPLVAQFTVSPQDRGPFAPASCLVDVSLAAILPLVQVIK